MDQPAFLDRACFPMMDHDADFLRGGGKMGALMRAHDWASTPFGPVQSWASSLRSAVGICLGTSFPIAIYWGPELALLYNDAWSNIPGEKHPWALGRPGRAVWPEIWDTIGPLYEKVQTTGEGVWQQDQLLLMYRHGYTEECHFNFTFSPIRGEGGRVEGIFNAVVETTFRVLSERRERFLRTLAEQLASARSETDVYASAAEMFAEDPADLPFSLFYRLDASGKKAHLVSVAGVQRSDLVAPEVFDLADAKAPWPLTHVLQSGRPEVATGVPVRLGGLASCRSWAEPVRTALVVPIATSIHAGAIIGFLVAGLSPRRALDDEYRTFVERAAAHVAASLSNVRVYEEERRRAEGLAEIDRAKTLFFSNISHEFRTPLTLLLGPLEESLAQADRLPHDECQRIGVAHRNGLRLLKLVNSLLDFSRIEAGRAQAHFEPTEIAALTAELASNFRSAIEKAGLRLVVDCPPLSEPVYVDRDMWERVVLNLLSNAFKFTFEGEITVTIRARDGLAEFIVRDTGTGIPRHELSRLFERFHRIEGARGRSFEGSGIGLALVHELVKLHGGNIRVESEEERGSAFITTVPFGAKHLPSDRIGSERSLASTAVRAHAYVEEAQRWLPGGAFAEETVEKTFAEPLPELAAAPAGERAHVLLADDNADMRDYVSRLLGGRHEVESVRDGQAALETLRNRPPDLVLTDILMPKLDGFALIRAIREDTKLRDLPIIVLSARAGEEANVEGLSAGADDYVVKPFSARELIARVDRALAMARLRRQMSEELRALNETLEQRVADEVARRSKAEDELRQAQKMEAIGHLTGGLAHDFNNLLTIVVGSIDSLQRHFPPDAPDTLQRAAENAMQGAKRAVGLTQRLLAISRRQPLESKPTEVNRLVAGMSDLLVRTLGGNIEVETVLADGLWRVEVDPNQLESTLLNLAVNARDAMPKGGKLTIETANAHPDELHSVPEAEALAEYVVLAVSDTGSGMSHEVLARAFEPFFTTKPTGHGTGLGLSQVFGLVKQWGGHVKLYSELGRGTTVKIYLPRLMGSLRDKEEVGAATGPDGRRGETIPLVDDN